jgi:hypothetical protein
VASFAATPTCEAIMAIKALTAVPAGYKGVASQHVLGAGAIRAVLAAGVQATTHRAQKNS